MVGAVISVVFLGFLIGSLARLAIPGPDPMPFWLTVLVGMGGSLVGGSVAAAIYGTRNVFQNSNHAFVTLLLEVGSAIAIVALYRRFVQRRPLSGPDAYRFPARGVGIERMRSRLRKLGIDPDRLTAKGGATAPPATDLSPDERAAELAELRERRDRGEISEDEYDQARERLRRY